MKFRSSEYCSLSLAYLILTWIILVSIVVYESSISRPSFETVNKIRFLS